MALYRCGLSGGSSVDAKWFSIESASIVYYNVLYNIGELKQAGKSSFKVTPVSGWASPTALYYIYNGNVTAFSLSTSVSMSSWDASQDVQIRIDCASGQRMFNLIFE